MKRLQPYDYELWTAVLDFDLLILQIFYDTNIFLIFIIQLLFQINLFFVDLALEKLTPMCRLLTMTFVLLCPEYWRWPCTLMNVWRSVNPGPGTCTSMCRVLTLTGLVTGGQCQAVRQESRRAGLPMYQTIVSYITPAGLGAFTVHFLFNFYVFSLQ